MSRKWFWGLLLANAIFFASMRWGYLLTAESDAVLTQPAMQADKIVLLEEAASAVRDVPEKGKMSPPTPAKDDAASTPAAAGADAVAPRLSTELSAAASAQRCLYWGEFSGVGLKLVRAELDKLGLGERLQTRAIEHSSGFWVYLPPQRSMSMVQRKVEQLKNLGVHDYFVVQEEGAWQRAISLGVFRTQHAAENYLAVLRKQGVRTAKVSERKSKLRFTQFVIQEADDALEAKLQGLQKDFPDSELKMSDCN